MSFVPPRAYDAFLKKREKVAEDTYLITLSLNRDFRFMAGQYVLLSLQHGPERASRELSIASLPSRIGEIELAYRQSGSKFKSALATIALGSVLSVEGPFGTFIFPDEPALILCIASGIGITPFRSMILDARERGLKHQITLLYINSREDRAAFIDDFRTLAQRSRDFKLVPVVGRQSDEALRHYADEWKTGKIYIAGATEVVFDMRAKFISFGTNPANVRTEEFTGYGNGGE